jgi:hypothetical protein
MITRPIIDTAPVPSTSRGPSATRILACPRRKLTVLTRTIVSTGTNNDHSNVNVRVTWVLRVRVRRDRVKKRVRRERVTFRPGEGLRILSVKCAFVCRSVEFRVPSKTNITEATCLWILCKIMAEK